MKQLIITLFLFILLLPDKAISSDTVFWITEHFEPYFIESGPLKNQGLGDRINRILIENLPQYHHEIGYMPILRITEALERGKHITCVSYLKNPNDSTFCQYSITSMVVPPLEITLRKEDWVNKWKRCRSISLKEFFHQGNVIGIAGRRYYGDNLSPLLEYNRSNSNNVYVIQSSHYLCLAKMLVRKRIDATIGYAAELKYYQNIDKNGEKLVSLPIVENPDFLYAYVVIPKTKWGDKFKIAVDKVLKKIRNTKEYKNIMFNWFGKPENYQKAMEKRFLSDK